MALCPVDSDAWVIGGAEIYAQALPLASTALVTEIEQDYPGDAYAPEFGSDEWLEISREQGKSTEGFNFSFITYKKKI